MKVREITSDNEKDIQTITFLERTSFELTGNDPVEFREVIQYIAKYGKLLLGYDTTQEGEEIPFAFIELITLDKSLEFYKDNRNINSLKRSPFMIAKREAGRIYQFARSMGYEDADIVDHHGIGVDAQHQGLGIGRQLLEYAMNTDIVSGRLVQCNIDIVKRLNGTLDDIFNERSFALHLNRGFVVADVLQPPVYEDSIVYAATIKSPRHILDEAAAITLDIADLRRNTEDLVRRLKELTTAGYVGSGYNKERKEMRFAGLR